MLTLIRLLPLLVLAGCSVATAVPPAPTLRDPDSRLMAPPVPLAPLPGGIRADPALWNAYGQCRVAHADEADLRSGLVAHWQAIKGGKPAPIKP